MAEHFHTTFASRVKTGRRTLADDLAIMPRGFFSPMDTDAELYTYPECIDQTQIGQIGMQWGGAFADDDMEIDDGE